MVGEGGVGKVGGVRFTLESSIIQSVNSMKHLRNVLLCRSTMETTHFGPFNSVCQKTFSFFHINVTISTLASVTLLSRQSMLMFKSKLDQKKNHLMTISFFFVGHLTNAGFT